MNYYDLGFSMWFMFGLVLLVHFDTFW